MIGYIIIILILIILNALFVAIEMSFITLNDLKIEKEARKGNQKAIKIDMLLKSPSKFLATIQIGITFVGFLSSAVAASTFADFITPHLVENLEVFDYNTWNIIVVVLITIIVSTLMLIFGELVPKRIAMKYPEKVSYATIGLLRFVYVLFKPFVYLLTKITNAVSKLIGIGEHEEELVTEEEVKMIIDECHENGNIQKYEKDYIHNVLKLNDVKISKVMTPKNKVVMIDGKLTFEEVLNILLKDEFKYSKYPVVINNEITGIIHCKDVIKNIKNNKIKLSDIVRSNVSIDSEKYIFEALKILRNKKTKLGVVMKGDNYIGIVTIEDIVEEIVGDIYDEFDKV